MKLRQIAAFGVALAVSLPASADPMVERVTELVGDARLSSAVVRRDSESRSSSDYARDDRISLVLPGYFEANVDDLDSYPSLKAMESLDGSSKSEVENDAKHIQRYVAPKAPASK